MPNIINEDAFDATPHFVSTNSITVVGRTVVVHTIRDRNQLNPKPAFVYVIDATDDPTVDKGSALYMYTPNSTTVQWKKLYETEMMDFVIEPVGWDDLTIRPESSIEDIDLAVQNSHEHSNYVVLSDLGDDNGQLTYKNQPVFPDLSQTFSAIDDRIESLNNSIADNNVAISSINSNINNISESIDNVSSSIEQINSNITSLESNTVSNEEFNSQINTLNETITTIQESGQDENREIRENIETIDNDLQSTKDEINSSISIKADQAYVDSELNKKVDKIPGKSLSDENFTFDEKQKLANLENYDDRWFRFCAAQFVQSEPGKGLSSNDFTNEYKLAIDTLVSSDIAGIEQSLSVINSALANKADKIHNHDTTYALIDHEHDDLYAVINHNHDFWF